jgi:hypothetical protein
VHLLGDPSQLIDNRHDVAYRARMITAVDRVAAQLTRAKAGYEQWEQRQIAKRFAGWSVRRRLTVFVLLPVVLICGAGVVSIPALWLVGATVDAGRGAPSADAAASEYLMRLSYGNEDGLLPVLDDSRQDELLGQWREYLAAMRATDPPPFRLEFEKLGLAPATRDQTEVRTDVQAVWWDTDNDGRTSGYSSSPRTWLIEVREDDGWRVSKVSAPPWCGADGYVRRCPGDPVIPTQAASPTPSPSLDLLQYPREMLRCGPRDPFRKMHSCPPGAPSPTE